MPRPTDDPYLRHDELVARLAGLASAHPGLLELSPIGHTFEGREILLATLTDTATGPASGKPALLVTAGIHANELASTSVAMALVERVPTAAEAGDAAIRRLLSDTTIYVVPRIAADGAERLLADRPSFVRSSVRPYPAACPPLASDLDGDGRILAMRVPDPNGAWVVSDLDPRLLERRAPDAPPRPDAYRLLWENEAEVDAAAVASLNTRIGIDLNRTFPFDWRSEDEQWGAGPYPGSEPETAAILRAVVERPNIVTALSCHTYGGLYFWFSGHPRGTYPGADRAVYDVLAREAAARTGYPSIAMAPDPTDLTGSYSAGQLEDWLYQHRGIFAGVVELWNPLRAAGIGRTGLNAGGDADRWFEHHDPADELALLAWSDRELDGTGFVPWYPVSHPTLGEVELGGWELMRTINNPPASLLAAEVGPHVDVALYLASIVPHLAIRSLAAEPLGEGLWRVTVVAENRGWLPTEGSAKAIERGRVGPVRVTIGLPDGAELLGGPATVELGQLAGRTDIPAMRFRLMPQFEPGDLPGDRSTASWVVRALAGSVVTVAADHDRAGTASAQVALTS